MAVSFVLEKQLGALLRDAVCSVCAVCTVLYVQCVQSVHCVQYELYCMHSVCNMHCVYIGTIPIRAALKSECLRKYGNFYFHEGALQKAQSWKLQHLCEMSG